MKNNSVFSEKIKSVILDVAEATIIKVKRNIHVIVKNFTLSSAVALATIPLIAEADDKKRERKAQTYEEKSLIVAYRKGVTVEERRSARALIQANIFSANNSEKDPHYRNLLNGRLANYRLDKLSVEEAIERLKDHPAILYAEPDYILQTQASPNDSNFSDLWAMHNLGQTGGTEDADIDAVEAWDIATGSREVVVGIIDSGIDYRHPDLRDNIWTNPREIPEDGIDNDGNGYIDDIHGINTIIDSGDPMDDNSHGTHVAGTIGAVGNNDIGVVGVNHKASLIGCKFLDSAGFGSTANAIKCIDYMVALKNQGVNLRIMNNSWGGGEFSQALADAINASEQADILFVAAAGNSGTDSDTLPAFPASYENDTVLSVAGTNHLDKMYIDSNYGLVSVDLGAPGVNILSTTPGGDYVALTGTSMASPHVAGAAALALSVNPTLSALELKQILMDSGDEIEALTGKTVSGKRLNLLQTLIGADPSPRFTLGQTETRTTLIAGENQRFAISINAISDWQGEVQLSAASNLENTRLSATTAGAGDIVELLITTTAETLPGDYEITVNGVSGELTNDIKFYIKVYPYNTELFNYTNNIPLAIPDADETGIRSTLTVTDPFRILDAQAHVDIQHTFIGDLKVTLTSPSGTTYTLHDNEGGPAQNISKSYKLPIFENEFSIGIWTLTIQDLARFDTGTLAQWSLNFLGTEEEIPSLPPVASFTYSSTFLNTNFIDTSFDANEDITFWFWEFGDGFTSNDKNPNHIYTEPGEYDVTLTVTDTEGATSSVTKSISVVEQLVFLDIEKFYISPLDTIRVILSWNVSSGDKVTIIRNGKPMDIVSNKGRYIDRERNVDDEELIYQVCTNTKECSNTVAIELK